MVMLKQNSIILNPTEKKYLPKFFKTIISESLGMLNKHEKSLKTIWQPTKTKVWRSKHFFDSLV